MMSSFLPLTAPRARGNMSTADMHPSSEANAQRPPDPFRKCDLPNIRLKGIFASLEELAEALAWGVSMKAGVAGSASPRRPAHADAGRGRDPFALTAEQWVLLAAASMKQRGASDD